MPANHDPEFVWGLQTDPQVWCVFFAWLDRESPGSFLGHCGESQSPETSLD